MDEQERQHLQRRRNILRPRLYERVEQADKLGPDAPPHINIEIRNITQQLAEIDAKLGGEPAAICAQAKARALYREALQAITMSQLEQAEALLEQVAAIDPAFSDVQARLAAVRHDLKLRTIYETIGSLRKSGNWEAALRMYAELDRQAPDHPDPQGHRCWAERCKYRDLLRRAAHLAIDRYDLNTAIAKLNQLLEDWPDDLAARAMLDIVLKQQRARQPDPPSAAWGQDQAA